VRAEIKRQSHSDGAAADVQAILSNVHRHAQSPSAGIRFVITAREAKLEMKDFGNSINRELLERFKTSGVGRSRASESGCASWEVSWKLSLAQPEH
jgi:signal transduction histidine kinase